MQPVFFITAASIGARVFSRLARSRKINLTVPSGSASVPISAIHWHAYSIWDTLFSVLASIPHSLSGSHLAAANYLSLCVLSLLLSISLCVPVYVEREVLISFDLARSEFFIPISLSKDYPSLLGDANSKRLIIVTCLRHHHCWLDSSLRKGMLHSLAQPIPTSIFGYRQGTKSSCKTPK